MGANNSTQLAEDESQKMSNVSNGDKNDLPGADVEETDRTIHEKNLNKPEANKKVENQPQDHKLVDQQRLGNLSASSPKKSAKQIETTDKEYKKALVFIQENVVHQVGLLSAKVQKRPPAKTDLKNPKSENLQVKVGKDDVCSGGKEGKEINENINKSNTILLAPRKNSVPKKDVCSPNNLQDEKINKNDDREKDATAEPGMGDKSDVLDDVQNPASKCGTSLSRSNSAKLFKKHSTTLTATRNFNKMSVKENSEGVKKQETGGLCSGNMEDKEINENENKKNTILLAPRKNSDPKKVFCLPYNTQDEKINKNVDSEKDLNFNQENNLACKQSPMIDEKVEKENVLVIKQERTNSTKQQQIEEPWLTENKRNDKRLDLSKLQELEDTTSTKEIARNPKCSVPNKLQNLSAERSKKSTKQTGTENNDYKKAPRENPDRKKDFCSPCNVQDEKINKNGDREKDLNYNHVNNLAACKQNPVLEKKVEKENALVIKQERRNSTKQQQIEEPWLTENKRNDKRLDLSKLQKMENKTSTEEVAQNPKCFNPNKLQNLSAEHSEKSTKQIGTENNDYKKVDVLIRGNSFHQIGVLSAEIKNRQVEADLENGKLQNLQDKAENKELEVERSSSMLNDVENPKPGFEPSLSRSNSTKLFRKYSSTTLIAARTPKKKKVPTATLR